MHQAFRRYATAGITLVGASMIAVTPVTAPPPGVHLADIQLTAGDEQDIVIDILRHGQRMPPQNLETNQSPPYPGVPLSELGQQQAQDVGNKLFNELGGPNGVAGIFSGQGIRDMDTAAPFAALEQMPVQILPGLDELDPGILANLPLTSPGGILAELIVLVGALGFEFATAPGSSDAGGVDADEKFTGAVDTMYNAAMANPVVSANGQITDVAFNNEASVALWVALNTKNYELPLFVA
ncbi:MAG: histidine phosphatase family protein, partial [Mycobacterium sp.]